MLRPARRAHRTLCGPQDRSPPEFVRKPGNPLQPNRSEGERSAVLTAALEQNEMCDGSELGAVSESAEACPNRVPEADAGQLHRRAEQLPGWRRCRARLCKRRPRGEDPGAIARL